MQVLDCGADGPHEDALLYLQVGRREHPLDGRFELEQPVVKQGCGLLGHGGHVGPGGAHQLDLFGVYGIFCNRNGIRCVE